MLKKVTKIFNKYKYTDKEMEELISSMVILIDTREKAARSGRFPARSGIHCPPCTGPSGRACQNRAQGYWCWSISA